MSTLTPQMSLYLPTIGVDSGLTWEQKINANTSIIDGHNHSPGAGAPITSASLNINADLTFSDFNAINLRSVRFTAQGSPLVGASDLGCIYVSGVDLYYNDENGNQIRLTQGGGMTPVTASEIVDGTASASFVSGVLTVVSAPSTWGDIRLGSIILGNAGTTNTHFATISPPSALSASYSITLPGIQTSQKFLAMDTSGNITGYAAVVAGITGAMIAAGTITGSNIAGSTITASNIAGSTITASQIAAGTITGTQIASNANFAGNAVQENGKNVVVSSTNATSSLAIIRGVLALGYVTPPGSNTAHSIYTGEGFTITSYNGQLAQITFSNAFADTPSVVCSTTGLASDTLIAYTTSLSPSSFFIGWQGLSSGGGVSTWYVSFIAIGQRT